MKPTNPPHPCLHPAAAKPIADPAHPTSRPGPIPRRPSAVPLPPAPGLILFRPSLARDAVVIADGQDVAMDDDGSIATEGIGPRKLDRANDQ